MTFCTEKPGGSYRGSATWLPREGLRSSVCSRRLKLVPVHRSYIAFLCLLLIPVDALVLEFPLGYLVLCFFVVFSSTW